MLHKTVRLLIILWRLWIIFRFIFFSIDLQLTNFFVAKKAILFFITIIQQAGDKIVYMFYTIWSIYIKKCKKSVPGSAHRPLSRSFERISVFSDFIKMFIFDWVCNGKCRENAVNKIQSNGGGNSKSPRFTDRKSLMNFRTA